MKYSYSFTQNASSGTGTFSAPSPSVTENPVAEYAYNEFILTLPSHWRQTPTTSDNSLVWSSQKDRASITVSADFYEVPAEKQQRIAEFCLDERHSALESVATGELKVITRSIKPHSGSVGLEVAYAATIPGATYLYVGYVTPRKVFNFALTGDGDSPVVIALFNRAMSEWLQVRLP